VRRLAHPELDRVFATEAAITFINVIVGGRAHPDKPSVTLSVPADRDKVSSDTILIVLLPPSLGLMSSLERTLTRPGKLFL
jgi:hypothetical protein